jgi:hypothetical protein
MGLLAIQPAAGNDPIECFTVHGPDVPVEISDVGRLRHHIDADVIASRFWMQDAWRRAVAMIAEGCDVIQTNAECQLAA